MKILFITSEANPFFASGGLGDVMGALPGAINELDNENEISVIMPLYNTMAEEKRRELSKVVDINFKLSWRSSGASIYKTYKDGVNYYFIENHYYFDRNSLYGEYDDGERFAFFGMAVIEFLIKTDSVPDIIHANDWQCALPIIYLKTKYKDVSELKNIKSVFTVHNIEYQGKYDMAILGDVFALDSEYLGCVEYGGCINLMKGALISADYVTTVSPNYANELNYDYFAYGLSDIIKKISHKFKGIINGIDYNYFSPENDKSLDYPYTKRGYKTGKAKNKKSLQADFGLKVDEKIPLLAMITRLTETKGIDLFLHISEELLSKNIQMIVLGSGEEKFESKLLELNERYDNFRVKVMFNRDLSKKIYAASDIFIMPSKSEPCGLAQLISLSYGTIPVVREVGGLYDTITPYGNEGSNGFSFKNYNAHELLDTVLRAVSLYENDKEEWNNLVRRAIKCKFDWESSAKEYLAIYKEILGK